MSTSEDDEAFGSDPFGLRDLWRRNRGCPNPASAASASAASGAPFALASNSPSVAASGAPDDVAPSPLVALAASGAAGVIDDEACQRSFPPLSDQSASAWARSAELPRHRSIVIMERWQHKANLHGPLEQLLANCQASIADDDPIQILPPIGQEQTVSQTAAKLLGVIDAEVALGKRARVYVGACVDVARRWHGTTRAEFEAYRTQPLAGTTSTPAKRRKWLYPGHKRKDTKMFVVASADASVSILLEGLMISMAKCRCEGDDALHCENGPMSASWAFTSAFHHNWIYVCIGEAPVAPLSSFYKRTSPFALS